VKSHSSQVVDWLIYRQTKPWTGHIADSPKVAFYVRDMLMENTAWKLQTCMPTGTHEQ